MHVRIDRYHDDIIIIIGIKSPFRHFDFVVKY